MQEILAALLSFFLVQPIQAELQEKLAAARAPAAVVSEVTACVRDAALPSLIAACPIPGGRPQAR